MSTSQAVACRRLIIGYPREYGDYDEYQDYKVTVGHQRFQRRQRYVEQGTAEKEGREVGETPRFVRSLPSPPRSGIVGSL
jgi:hypothetical protein